MSLLRSIIKGILIESILLEGPLDKMRNMGMPEPFAEYFYEILPEYSKSHAHWYALQISEMMHQFKDYILEYKKAIKKARKNPELAQEMKTVSDFQFQKWKDVVNDSIRDIEVIDKWAQDAGINISKKKEVNVLVGDEREDVPFDFSSAIRAAKEYYNLQDGKIIMALPGGWTWIDRESHVCSVEASLMGHCGRSDNTNSTLYSLRDPQGMPHVTAEMEPTPDGYIVKQMKGKRNTTPDEKYHGMIYALLKNPNFKLVGYQADGRHGGDLKWDDIPEEVQNEIFETHENFDSSQGDTIEVVISRIDAEINSAIEEAEQENPNSIFGFHFEGCEEYSDTEGYARVDLSLFVPVSEKITSVLDEISESERDDIINQVLNYYSIYGSDIEFETSDGFASIKGYILDEDNSSMFSIIDPDVDSIVSNISYYMRMDVTQEKIENSLENLLRSEGYIDRFETEHLEFSNFELETDEVDIHDEEYGHITATSKPIGNLADIKDDGIKTEILSIINDKSFAKTFYANLVDYFAPNLKQLILPHVDTGPAIPLSIPVGATLYNDQSSVRIQIVFNEKSESGDEFIGFLKSMDSNLEVASRILTKLIKDELNKTNFD